MEAARLSAIIEADTSKGEASIKSFGSRLEESGGKVGGFIKNVAGIAGGMAVFGLVAGGVSLVKDQLFDMVHAGADANAVAAQTAAVLKSTHGAAGVTAASVENLSTKLMNLTGIDDDTISSTQNMLLTFTNIGAKGGVFDQATKTALDMSVALGQDTKSSAIQLGKALNDPLTGITALQRVGVTFDKTQKDQIANFMKAGDVAGAQGVILKELNKEFGGSAEAAGRANGGVKILAAQFDNMKQSIGQAVIPMLSNLLIVIEPLIGQFANALPGALSVAETWFSKHVVPALFALANFIQTDVIPAVMRFADFVGKNVVPALIQLFHWAQDNIVPVIKTLAAVFFTNVLPALQGVWASVSAQLIPALQRLWNQLSPVLIPALKLVGFILQNIVAPAAGILIGAISDLIDKIAFLLNLLGKAKDALADLGSHLKDVANIPVLGGIVNGLSGGALASHASGTMFTSGGPALVGERGPELVIPPRGSTVLSARDTRAAMAGAGGNGSHTTVNIYPQKADLNAADLSRHLRRVALHASTGGAY